MIIQQRRGTTEEWRYADTIANKTPDVILKDGEFAIEDLADGTRRVKIGDGSTNFYALPYIDERAELEAYNKILDAKEVLTKKLLELDAAHKRLVANTRQELIKQLDLQHETLSNTIEANTNVAFKEVYQYIDTEINGIQTDVNKNNQNLDEVAKTVATQLSNAESRLSSKIMSTANELNGKLTNTVHELAASTDIKFNELEYDIKQNLADSLAQHAERNDIIFSELISQLKLLEEKAQKLGNTNISLSNVINEVNSTLTTNVDQLATNLYELTLRHDMDYNTVLASIDSKENDRIEADHCIISSMAEYISKIYIELADLVDDDILILEKAFSVENYLTSRINATDKDLSDLAEKVHDLSPEEIGELEARFNIRIDELDIALRDELSNTISIFDDKVNNVKEIFNAAILEREAILRAHIAKEDSIIADKLTIINQELLEELNASKLELETSFSSIEQNITNNIEIIVKDLSTAKAELADAIVKIEEKLVNQITDTENKLTEELTETRSLFNNTSNSLQSEVDELISDLDSVKQELTDTVGAVEQNLSRNISSVDERLSTLGLTVNDQIADVETLIQDKENLFTSSLNSLAATVSNDIESFKVIIENKITSLDADDPDSSDVASYNFINTVKQEDGRIIATKSPLPVADEYTAGITTLGVIGGAATYSQAAENADEIAKLKLAISGGVHFVGITTSSIYNGFESNSIIIDDLTYNAAIGDITIYSDKEFIWTGSEWKELGDLSRVGILETWRNGLNISDESQTNQFLVAVSQLDGKINVSRARPTASDIKYGNSNLEAEISAQSKAFSDLLARSVQLNTATNSLFIGNDVDDTIIICCGTASDV